MVDDPSAPTAPIDTLIINFTGPMNTSFLRAEFYPAFTEIICDPLRPICVTRPLTGLVTELYSPEIYNEATQEELETLKKLALKAIESIYKLDDIQPVPLTTA